ncbi:MAG: 5-formyltetrahydrofolate cyclo-ligase [Alphaproteobacteria bacterium]|nr:5-formyltetrahydrofolate cyclo-ligase [Alphaproteobacteria bacterium]
MTDLIEAKRVARAAARAVRAAAHARADATAAPALRDRVLAAIAALPEAAGPISGFWSMGDEIDVRPLLRALDAAGHVVALPVTVGRDRPLLFRRWRPDVPLVAGGFGTSVPAADAEVVVPRILIVPMLAFDRSGHRLGYGGGYYDRTLTGLRATGTVHAIGVAFAAQEVGSVPHGAADARLDLIVTERETIVPGRPAGGLGA